MKVLRSLWVLAILALTVNMTILSLLFYLNQDQFQPPRFEEKEVTPLEKWTFQTKELDGLSVHLKTLESTLKLREEKIAIEASRINAERNELEKIRKQLEQFQRQLDESVLKIKESEMKNLKAMAATYSAMDPQSAKEIFNSMPDNLILKIVVLMPPETVAQIFAGMAKDEKNAQRAAVLTEAWRLLQRPEKEKKGT